jgi:hypothetical protein
MNVVKYNDPWRTASSAAWQCTQQMDWTFLKIKNEGEQTRKALETLLLHVFDDSFSAITHYPEEDCSWFSYSAKNIGDPRVRTIEAWEEATLADPGFATNVRWLPTGKSLDTIVDHAFRVANYGDPRQKIGSHALAAAVSRVHSKNKRKKRKKK